MELQEYLEKHKQINKFILEYIDKSGNIEENYQNLINLFEHYNIQDDSNELKLFFHLLLNIANNHHRNPGFMDKIFQIITYFKDNIRKHYSNSEIFNIFKNNKRILLFLIENKIFEINKNISNLFLTSNYSENKYTHYFYPEIKIFLDERKKKELFNEIQKNIDTIMPNDLSKSEDELIAIIDQQRTIGENESYICKFIRQDSVDDFINYIDENELPLDSIINPSLFESNPFLIQEKVRLIDYCAFFGSSKIFHYIISNLKNIEQSTWLFAVHSQNEEIFQDIKSNLRKLDSSFVESIIIESIKCHHNDALNYVKNNLIDESIEISNNFSKSYIQYFNFLNVQPNIINQSTFVDLVTYDYFSLVKLLLKNEDIDVNAEGVLITFNSISTLKQN